MKLLRQGIIASSRPTGDWFDDAATDTTLQLFTDYRRVADDRIWTRASGIIADATFFPAWLPSNVTQDATDGITWSSGTTSDVLNASMTDFNMNGASEGTILCAFNMGNVGGAAGRSAIAGAFVSNFANAASLQYTDATPDQLWNRQDGASNVQISGFSLSTWYVGAVTWDQTNDTYGVSSDLGTENTTTYTDDDFLSRFLHSIGFNDVIIGNGSIRGCQVFDTFYTGTNLSDRVDDMSTHFGI